MLRREHARAFATAENCNLFFGVYESFDEARRHMPSNKASDYDHAATAAMYRNRLERAAPTDYPTLFWLA